MKLAVLKLKGHHRRNMSKISKKYRHDPSQAQQAIPGDPPTNYNDGELHGHGPMNVVVTECQEDSSLSNLSSSTTSNGSGSSGCGSCDGSAFTNLQMDQATALAASAAVQQRSTALSAAAKKTMLDAFQPWVLRTYGDAAKTKTITLKKCARIIKTLNGEEASIGFGSVENSKFRFWVKTKGFQTKYEFRNEKKPTGSGARLNNNYLAEDELDSELQQQQSPPRPAPVERNKIQEYLQLKPDLFVPSLVKEEAIAAAAVAATGDSTAAGGVTTIVAGPPTEKHVLKRVAIVEHFFDIIYTVHTKIEAKNGKHAGQKRTYRAITEKYAFLPREAVTHFLLLCADCQKRMSPGPTNVKAKHAIESTPCPPAESTTPKDATPPQNRSPGTPILREPNTARPGPGRPPKRRRMLKPAIIKKAVNTIVKKSKQRQEEQDRHRILPISIAALKRQHDKSQTPALEPHKNGKVEENSSSQPPKLKRGPGRPPKHRPAATGKEAATMDANYCLPFTTTYLRQQQQQKQNVDQETQTAVSSIARPSRPPCDQEIKIEKETQSPPIPIDQYDYDYNSASRSRSSSIKAEANSSSSSDDSDSDSEDDESSSEEDEFESEAEDEKILFGTAGSRMVKMSGASGRKRLAPTKLGSSAGKVKKGHGHDGTGDDDVEFGLSLKESGSSADENQEQHTKPPLKHSKSAAATVDWLGYPQIGLGGAGGTNNNNSIFMNGCSAQGGGRKQSSPISLTEREGHHHVDEDDDDEDSLDKADGGGGGAAYDPERLKAFNMFVRLFVDENLDRMVPISKQPKEKIQAIIDSCTRQFPEYAERARKRIRTYLKSCRRNKRIKDGGGAPPGLGVGGVGGWESTRPTPAHLTSAQAEQVLAQACENESQNAKRMRMGLEPISQPLPSSSSSSAGGGANGFAVSRSSSSDSTPSPEKILKHSSSPSTTTGAMPSPSTTAATISAVVAAAVQAASANSTCSSLSSPSSGISSLSAFSDTTNSSTHNHGAHGVANPPPHINLLSSSHFVGNGSASSSPESPLMNSTSMSGLSKLVGAEQRGNGIDYSRRLNGTSGGGSGAGVSMYKPNFCQSLSKPGLFSAAANGLSNGDAGPTDLSMKAKSATTTSALLSQHLNLTELTTVRQLIIGYRESAAFLLRSADELEQLLIQQQ